MDGLNDFRLACEAATKSQPVTRNVDLDTPRAPVRTRQVNVAPGWWQSVTGGGNLNLRLGDAYKTHPWVFATLSSRKRHVTAARLTIGTESLDGKVVEATPRDGEKAVALRKLFKRPNRSMSGKMLVAFTQLWLDLLGECFWILGRSNITQVPDFIMPWAGGSIWKIHAEGADGLPLSWEVTKPDGNRLILSVDQVVHFRTENPNNVLRGCPPLASATITLNSDIEADEHMLAKFRNGVEPGGFLHFNDGLDEETYAEVRRQIEDKHQGARKAGKMLITEGGATFQPNTQTNRDLEYLGLREWNKNVVLGVMNWPETALGMTSGQTFANAAQANRDLWFNHVIPLQDEHADTIDAQLLRGIEGGRFVAHWDRSQVDALAQVEESKWGTANEMKKAGLTLVEIDRKLRFGLKRQPGDTTVLVPNTNVPIEAVAAGATVPGAAVTPVTPGATGDTSTPPTMNELDAAMLVEIARDELATQQARDLHAKAITALDTVEKQERARGAARRWDAWWDQVLRPSERAYIKPLREYFTALSSTIMRQFNAAARSTRAAPGLPLHEAKITTADIERIIFDRAEWDARLRSISREAFNAAADFSSAFTTEVLSTLVGPQVVGIDLNAAPVQRFINARSQLVTGINDRIERQLALQLRQGIANGEGIRELRVRIANISGRLSDPARTLRIARTEQGTIASTIKFEEASAALDMGRWLTANDEDVRNTHFVAEFSSFDRPVLLGRELFSNGLRHPLDPTGPAGEVIACRCDLDMVPPDEADAILASRAVTMTADEMRLAFYGAIDAAAMRVEKFVQSARGTEYLDAVLGWDTKDLPTTCNHVARS